MVARYGFPGSGNAVRSQSIVPAARATRLGFLDLLPSACDPSIIFKPRQNGVKGSGANAGTLTDLVAPYLVGGTFKESRQNGQG